WLCQCGCGKTTQGTTTHLKAGNKKSCGCLVRENAKKKRVPKPSKPKQGFQTIIKKTDKVSKASKDTKKTPAFVVPPELKDVPYKMVENGLFQVFKNGRIFRHTKRG